MEFSFESGSAYEDGKTILRKLIIPLYEKLKRPEEIRTAKMGFSPKFLEHPEYVSELVDYYSWHASKSEWTVDAGVLHSATYGEVDIHWLRRDVFVYYEAFLKRFIASGGDVRRVFVLGHAFTEVSHCLRMQYVLQRHILLGFKPRIATVGDVAEELSKLSVTADSFLVLNKRIACFIRFADDGFPLLLKTSDPNTVVRAQNALNRLWKKALPADKWLSNQIYQLDADASKQIEHESRFIAEFYR